MALRAFQTINSSVDGHATCDNLICIYNRRVVTIPLKKKVNDIEVVTEEGIVVFTVGVFLKAPLLTERGLPHEDG